jgi:hypothetical protein|nr:MAG TPA: hypothetical protein [Caudoviricetes sp.]
MAELIAFDLPHFHVPDRSEILSRRIHHTNRLHIESGHLQWILPEQFAERLKLLVRQLIKIDFGNHRFLGSHHFGFSLESFSLVVMHSHDAFLRYRGTR